jgi:hypothetical protein
MIRCSKPGPITSCWPSSAAMSLSKASRSDSGFGGLHQPVEIVGGQSQSQLVQGGHGKLHIEKNKNAATGLWFSECISPFRRMPRPDSARALVRPTSFTIVTERDHPTVNMLLG